MRVVFILLALLIMELLFYRTWAIFLYIVFFLCLIAIIAFWLYYLWKHPVIAAVRVANELFFQLKGKSKYDFIMELSELIKKYKK